MTTDERMAQLEAQIDDLRAKLADLHQQMAKAQIDQWHGRIEDLEVQMHLGAMESSDRLNALMGHLRTRWSDARRQVEDRTSPASRPPDTIRPGLHNAFTAHRHAL